MHAPSLTATHSTSYRDLSPEGRRSASPARKSKTKSQWQMPETPMEDPWEPWRVDPPSDLRRHVWRPAAATEKTQEIWGGDEPSDLLMSDRRDIYMTPALFRPGQRGRSWRRAELLAALPGWWVDIDIRPASGRAPSLKALHAVLLAVIGRLRAARTPMPTRVVRSGRGWHIYWDLQKPIEVPADAAGRIAAIEKWRATAAGLAAIIGTGAHKGVPWHADSAASTDPVRVLRLPGSVHAGTGREVTSYATGAVVTALSMAKAVAKASKAASVTTEKPVRRTEKEPLPRHGDTCPACSKGTLLTRVAKTGRHAGTRLLGCGARCGYMQTAQGERIERRQPQEAAKPARGIKAWWVRTYWGILTHVREEWGGWVPQGRRDQVLLYLCVSIAQMTKDQAATEARIVDLGQSITDLSDHQIRTYMRQAVTGKYRYRRAILHARLLEIGIDLPHLRAPAASDRHTPEEIRGAQRRGAAATNARQRQDTASRIHQAISVLTADGQRATQAAVAAHTGLGIATVKRYWGQSI